MSPVAGTPRPSARAEGAAVDGLLVRRPARPGWLRTVPPAPPSAQVTVSLTNATAAIRHAAELAERGYVSVGAAGCARDDEEWADFMVPRALAASEEDWLRALLGPDGRLFEPRMGPVRALLGSVLEAHQG